MAKEVFEMTYEGVKELQQELEYRKTVLTTEIGERLKEAIALGDLSENSEYEDAREEQGKNVARMNEIAAILKRAKVIEEHTISNEKVTLGSKVKLLDVEFDEEMNYTLVGPQEEDILKNKISSASPVGEAIMNHVVGDTVVVRSPAGELEYKILEITK